jgi:tetratricopeptide (TPR) repeat protein
LTVAALLLAVPGPVPYLSQPPGPFCTAAAAAMLAQAHGRPLDALALAREVPVAADGIAWVDLAEALSKRGLETLVVQMDGSILRRTLAAGQPVIVSVMDAGRKHAWVLTGFRERDAGYDLLDPAQPGLRRATEAELASRWAQGQAILVHEGPLPAGLPAADWARQHRRFAALEYGLRAESSGRLDAAALALYDRALAQDPALAALHNNRGLVLVALGRKSDAREAFREALRRDPAFELARRNLAALDADH